MDIIYQNPFRVLGLPITSTNREIAKRLTELSILTDMGKKITYDSDYYLPVELIRSTETIKDAAQKISQPNDRLFYALFWFWEDSKNIVNKMALEELKIGNIDKAIEFWNRTADIISEKNYSILQMGISNIDNNFSPTSFLKGLENSSCIWGEFSFDDFVKQVIGETNSIDYSKVLQYYIDEIMKIVKPRIYESKEIEISHFLDYCSHFSDEILDMIISDLSLKYIHIIEKSVSEYDNNVLKNKSNAGKYGVDLIDDVKESIYSLIEMSSYIDNKYQPIIENVIKKLIGSGIAAWNENDVYYNDKIHIQINTIEEFLTFISEDSIHLEWFEKNFNNMKNYLEEKTLFAPVEPLEAKFQVAFENLESTGLEYRYEFAKNFVFSIKTDLDGAKELFKTNTNSDINEKIEDIISSCAYLVNKCAVEIANYKDQHGKAIELIDMARRILLYESNGELYTVNKILLDKLVDGRKIVSDNILNPSGGLTHLAIGGGIRMFKKNQFCGCGSGKKLNKCCSI